MRNILAFALLAIVSTPLYSYQKSDDEIRSILIQQSVFTYLSSVGNCPCPYNRDRAGRSCGKRSAWSRAGGYSPLCYPSDVTQDMILKYRSEISSESSSATNE